MNLIIALLAGALFAIAIFLMLRRSVVKLLIGLCVLSHATNLVIFTAGGLTRGVPPIVPEGQTAPPAVHADPLPQALILTAIVIGFGVLAFMMALISRAARHSGTDDSDAFTAADPKPTGEPHDTGHEDEGITSPKSTEGDGA